MIVTEKTYQNVPEYIQFSFKKDLNHIKKMIISSAKIRDSDNHNYVRISDHMVRIRVFRMFIQQ